MTDAAPARPASLTRDSGPRLLSIIALSAAALGLVIDRIPGTLGSGWGLMLIAFVLSIVALARNARERRVTTGPLLAFFGSVIALWISFSTGSTPFGGALGVVDGSVPQSSERASDPADEVAPLRVAAETAGDLAFGQTVVYANGIELTVSSPAPFTPSEAALGVDQDPNVVFTMTITNNSGEFMQPSSWPLVISDGQEGVEIVDVADHQLASSPGPDALVMSGGTVTWKSAWSVADPDSLTMLVSPDVTNEAATFTNVE